MSDNLALALSFTWGNVAFLPGTDYRAKSALAPASGRFSVVVTYSVFRSRWNPTMSVEDALAFYAILKNLQALGVDPAGNDELIDLCMEIDHDRKSNNTLGRFWAEDAARRGVGLPAN